LANNNNNSAFPPGNYLEKLASTSSSELLGRTGQQYVLITQHSLLGITGKNWPIIIITQHSLLGIT